MTATIVAAVALAAWLYLAFGRGGFWRGRETDQPLHDDLTHVPAGFAWPSVTAVIPARDEAELVGGTVASLLAQRYPGTFEIVVVDDHSDDGTALVARRAADSAGAGCAARLAVFSAPELPAGWTGKLWAVAHGLQKVAEDRAPPDYLLLTDADIRYAPEAVAALVFGAVRKGQVLSSLMVGLRCKSFAERAFIPAFVFFFQMIYPFAWVNRANRRTAAAAGGCMLVQRQALEAAGGIAAIRHEIIDDCALGARLKRVGPIRLALGGHVHSARACDGIGDIRHMVVRSAYAQLGYSPARLAFVVFAMMVVFIAPVALALAGDGAARALALATWCSMAALFVPITRRYDVSPWWGLALPAIAAAYLGFTVESALQSWRGRGGVWKGRAQARASQGAAR